MPRHVVVYLAASLALAPRGRAPAADPPKIHHSGGVFTFFGVQGGKKKLKLQDADFCCFLVLAKREKTP